jgi:hypothetical protein
LKTFIVATFVAGGDHGFRVKDKAGNLNQAKTQNNIDTVVKAALNWIDIND